MRVLKRLSGIIRLPAAGILPVVTAALLLVSAFDPFTVAGLAQWRPPGDPGADEVQEPTVDQDVYLHTVQWPGESLSLIAAWYTGDPRNWTILAAVSGGDGSETVRPSEVILIPKALLTTEIPMPRAFVDFYTQRNGRDLPRKTISQARRIPKPSPRKPARQGSSAEAAAPSEPLELFGPKE